MNVASIDIGTNTVLMLIAEINEKNIFPLLNEYRMPRIGRGLLEGSPIRDEQIASLFKVLEEYSGLIQKYDCKKVIIKATNAFRIASNSAEIISDIKRIFSFDVEIVSGKEEAYLSYLGAVSTVSSEKNIVIDIGGGSTELIMGSGEKIIFSKSFKAGVVNLTEKFLKHDPPFSNEVKELENHITKTFSELREMFPPATGIISVAGTPTTLSCIKQGLFDYDEDKVEGSVLTTNELRDFSTELSKKTAPEILLLYGNVVKGREDILLTGTLILYNVITLLGCSETMVSSRGIRYGSIIDYLNRNNV